MIREIRKYPDPILRSKGVKVESITPEIQDLITDLIDTMYAKDGAGLAAIQIGRLERIFVIAEAVAGHRTDRGAVVFINSEIVTLMGKAAPQMEGCLSFPGIFAQIPRFPIVVVKATSETGEEFTVKRTDLYAEALQHEHDHTMGKTFYDRAGQITRDRIRRRMGL